MTRANFILCAGLVLALAGQAGCAVAAEDFNPAALPHDKAALSKLNDEQLSLLRKSVRFCEDFGQTRHSMNFCVTSGLDLDVRQNGSPAMKALHWSLNPIDRYNDARAIGTVMKLVQE